MHSYTRYAVSRNDPNRKINSAKELYERRLAAECKDNPKAFWRYVQRKRKVREGISPLRKPSGQLSQNDTENVTELNNFLGMVSTIEKDITAAPGIVAPDIKETMGDLTVTTEHVKNKLKEHNCSRPDNIKP